MAVWKVCIGHYCKLGCSSERCNEAGDKAMEWKVKKFVNVPCADSAMVPRIMNQLLRGEQSELKL